MDSLVAGFWGAYFGAAALLLAGAFAALAQSLRRVALIAAVSAVVPSLFAAAFLGLIPLGSHPIRVLATVSMVCGALLGLMVLAMLGLMRQPARAWRIRGAMAAFTLAVIALGWTLEPASALGVSCAGGFGIGSLGLVFCVRRARRGDRLAGAALVSVSAVLLALGGLMATVLFDPVPWQVHAFSAMAGVVYVAMVSVVLWLRYSYLIELRQVIAHGPAYDPITRMRSHKETGQMVGLAFFTEKLRGDAPVGVVVISIGNLLTLERLHGLAAVNHGVFVTASRLRRCLPRGVEAGRLGDDGFLLLVRNAPDRARLVGLGRLVAERLSRPVQVTTSAQPQDVESSHAIWVAQVGVGVITVPAGDRPSAAITQARAMSQAAWSYPSRIACRNATGHVAEVSQPVPA